MSHKIVAFGFIASILFAVFGMIFASSDPSASSGFYTIAGLGYITFGIWTTVIFLQEK